MKVSNDALTLKQETVQFLTLYLYLDISQLVLQQINNNSLNWNIWDETS